MLINFQGICNKKSELKVLLEEFKPDIVQGTETWLSSSIHSNVIFPDDYVVFRRDRQVGQHGGILTACRNDLVMSRKEEFEGDGEILWTQIKHQGRRTLLIGTVYKHKHDDKDTVNELEQSFGKISRKGKPYNILLSGDFNQPNVNWEESTILANHAASKETAQALLETTTGFDLTQVVKERTRRNNILDLIFTNNTGLVSDVKVVARVSDHEIVIADLNLQARWKRQPRKSYFVRKKENVEQINSSIEDLGRTYFSLQEASVQEKWDLIEGGLKRIMKAHIPQKKAAKKALRKSLNSAEREFASNRLSDALRDNVKQFRSYKKRLGNSEAGVADPIVNNKIISDGREKAEVLNAQFAGVFTHEDCSNIPELGTSNIPAIPDLKIYEEGVLKQLRNLSPNKAPGPDQIPPWFLQMFADKLTPILTDLFQTSVDTGTLPRQWKEANICAVFKKGNKQSPDNYRPVSLTCVLSKVLEHIVHSHIMDHFGDYGILVDSQHGVRARRSTETQLILTVNDVAKALDRGDSIHMAILDFTKAFDKVPHERLLGKLNHYGIKGNLLNWIRGFLTGRSQRVICEGSTSSSKDVVSGVPQGTVLGPLMFLTYINDMPDKLKCQARLFADDCCIPQLQKRKTCATCKMISGCWKNGKVHGK
ncbi:uncharacterized protein LOC121406192 [Lytechinus variegatus]|uniref:uncharacterized protein LOC121406192 n=1 Tax=Lytechinus variegatus TaxID=7654 RepID=UPI001BB1FF64|nr:uncharacterized protein LOC121406192 [Lytechinus variegatus]